MSLMHWTEAIAKCVVEEKKEPYVIASGITTSGPVHLGTVCEFLYPSALDKQLHEEGYRTRFIFIGDIMDALDDVPASLREFEFLKDELGKPLCMVPDPFECCSSYGEHFLNQTVDVATKFEVYPEVLRADELYSAGKYDDYARIFIKKLSDVIHILEEVSIRKLPEGWRDIVLPICEECGKISTTTVKEFEKDTIIYSCDKDVGYTKGCGHNGETKISDHAYKLQWRLDWPSRQDFFNVSVEGAGVDHHTRGGSWDTAVAIHRKIFKKEPPIGFKYGFLLFKGKKYSKSKGLGLGVRELLDLVPPELMRYFLFKPNVEENKEFDPAGHKLIRLYDEYRLAMSLEKKKKLTRAEKKMLLAYKLAGKSRWKADFTEILINYQILRNWKAVAKKVGDPDGIYYLKPYIENWIDYGYIPEEFVFDWIPTKIEHHRQAIALFASRLNESMSALDVHNLVYEVAEEKRIKPPELFKSLYRTLIGKDHGPRFGKLIFAIGIKKVKRSLAKLYLSSSSFLPR